MILLYSNKIAIANNNDNDSNDNDININNLILQISLKCFVWFCRVSFFYKTITRLTNL